MLLAYLVLCFVSAGASVAVGWPSLGPAALLIAPFGGSAGVLLMAVIKAMSPEWPAGGRRVATVRAIRG